LTSVAWFCFAVTSASAFLTSFSRAYLVALPILPCSGKATTKQTIALRVAKEFNKGDIVNLGYGMPGLAANFIPEGKTVLF